MVDETGEKEVKEQEISAVDKVELSAETYTALLDRLEELEAQSKKNKVVPLEDLVDEAKQTKVESLPKRREVDETELDGMSNKKLVEYIFQRADEALIPVFQQLDTKIETIRVLREIDRLEKDPDCQGEDGKPDFWEYKDEVYQIASKNPNLSLKEAYNLAKHGSKKQPKEDKSRSLRALPPRPVLGERPGQASTVVRDSSPKTLKGAVEKAWEETLGDKKEV